MSQPSESNKLIAHKLKDAFGGTPQVIGHKHDYSDREIHLLLATDSPDPGLTTIGTVGLSDSPMLKDHQEFATRLELVGFCTNEDAKILSNILAAVSFYQMQTNQLIYPGFVLPNFTKEFVADTTVPHLYFSAPALWEDLSDTQLPDKRVNWLWVFPISESEARFIQEKGDNAFEDQLEASDADLTDMHRPSTV